MYCQYDPKDISRKCIRINVVRKTFCSGLDRLSEKKNTRKKNDSNNCVSKGSNKIISPAQPRLLLSEFPLFRVLTLEITSVMFYELSHLDTLTCAVMCVLVSTFYPRQYMDVTDINLISTSWPMDLVSSNIVTHLI